MPTSNRSPNNLPRFMQNAMKHDFNSREEEQRLSRRAHKVPTRPMKDAKDAKASRRRHRPAYAARDQLVSKNLRFILHQAIRNSRVNGVDIDDAFQEAALGHLEAIGKFKTDKGTRLSTYSSWWIRHAVLRYGQDHGRDVRIPVNTLEAARKLSKAAQKFESRFGRLPDDAELAECSGYPADRIAKVRVAVQESLSLNEPHFDGEGQQRTLQDVIPDARPGADVAAVMTSELAALDRALKSLTPFETAVLHCRFTEDLTLTQTAQALADDTRSGEALSRERIRQIQERALEKLRGLMVA